MQVLWDMRDRLRGRLERDKVQIYHLFFYTYAGLGWAIGLAMSGGSLFWNRNMIDVKEFLELCLSLRSEGRDPY